MAQRSDTLQGTLALLILRSLARGPAPGGPLHGYAITRHIETVSNALLRVEEGSLYPALRRMEEEGWIRSEWGVSDTNRKVRFYSLTPAGQKRLEQEEQSWERLSQGVALVLGFGG